MLHFRRFLKAKELGYLDDNSEFKFEESDINFIESLELQLDDYMDLFYDIDSGKFNHSYEYKNLVEFILMIVLKDLRVKYILKK